MTKKNWFLVAVTAVTISGGTYVASTNNEKVVTNPTPTVNVTTTNQYAVNFTTSSNAVDIFFLYKPQKNILRNLLDPTYSSLVKRVGFSNLVYPSVASISRYTHQKSTGTGYIGQQCDFPSYADYAAYGNGVLVTAWRDAFNVNNTIFTSSIGLRNDIVLNILNGNQSQHQAMLKAFNPQFVFLGAELQTSGMKATAYVDSCNKIIPFIRTYYPKSIIIGNATIMRRGNPASLRWNDTVKQVAADGFTNYNQIGDAENFTRNQDSNIIRINDYFNTQIPYEDSLFQSYFGTKKESVGEWMIEDNRGGNPQYVNRSITGIYGLGMFYQSFISRNNILNYTAWMSLSNLINDQNIPDVNYQALKQLNTLLAVGYKVGQVGFTAMDGITGIAMINGKSVIILANNSTTKTITPTITTDGKGGKITYTNIRTYSSDGTWYGAIKSDTVSTTTIMPCGYSIISYTTK